MAFKESVTRAAQIMNRWATHPPICNRPAVTKVVKEFCVACGMPFDPELKCRNYGGKPSTSSMYPGEKVPLCEIFDFQQETKA